MQPDQPLPTCTTVEVCADPKIVVASQFLTHEECEHFKFLGRQHGMQRAKLVGAHVVEIQAVQDCYDVQLFPSRRYFSVVVSSLTLGGSHNLFRFCGSWWIV